MTPRHLSLVFALALVGCESSPRPKSATNTTTTPAASTKLDADELVQTAEQLRDREFEKAPGIVAKGDLDVGDLAGCEARCAQERTWLTKVLFAGKPPVFPKPAASFDPERNVIEFRSTLPEDSARAAVLAELVRAVDDVHVEPADSWDGYLTSAALRRGSGVFVATLDRAKKRNPTIDAERLAMRPEAIYDLEFTQNRFADGFATREGFAFVAAMVRSGGWSTVELAYNERPTWTLQIVRPDRYLAGDHPGEWSLPAELQGEREKAGLELVRDGHVGPALFAEWLAQHVPAAAARAAYIGFETDSYQLFAAGETWTWDWVSLWSTPSLAEQVMAALEAGLRQRGDGARFIVLRKGATVAVVGSSDADADLTTPATALVGTLPVFPAPTPRGVQFTPTPIDRIAGRELVSSVPRASWTDTATGLVIDLGTLGDAWQLMPTQEPNLPWFAKHESGAVLQYLVEPTPLFDPPFDTPAFEKIVRERFTQTIISDEPPRVTRTDLPVQGSLRIEAEGKIKDRTAEGPVRLAAWEFANGPFLTTLSLQTVPDTFEERRSELEALLSSVKLDETADAETKGKIEFTVEE